MPAGSTPTTIRAAFCYILLCSGWLCFGWLCFGWLCFGWLGPQSLVHANVDGQSGNDSLGGRPSISNLPFPSPATPKLAASFQVTVSGQSMRELVNSMQSATRLPIVLDRRVDPTAAAISEPVPAEVDPQAEAPMRSRTLGPTLHQALDALVSGRNSSPVPVGVQRSPIAWASAGEVVLIGPQLRVEPAATEILNARSRLQPHMSRYPVRSVSWPELSTPSEVLQIVADVWKLDISDVQLPHDLWPAVDLGEVHVTTALGVIASQFDLHLQLDPNTRAVTMRSSETGTAESAIDTRRLQNRPAGAMLPGVVFRNRYPGLTLAAAQRESITSSGAKLTKDDDQWLLIGGANAHFQLELAIFRRGATARPSARAVTKYTLKFAGTAGDAFRNLCQAGNLTLDITALSAEQQQMMVELEVKDKSMTQILTAVAEKADVQIEIEGTQVTVKPK